MKDAVLVRPGRRIRLAEITPDDTRGLEDKVEAERRLTAYLERLRRLQRVLYADGRYSVLVVLQAMDTGGKDGTIRHVMSGLNPVGCVVTSFKAPTTDELARDFLWRVHRWVPAKGVIGVFNRSHYEDVLIARVRKLVPEKTWRDRYRQINDFERLLSETGTIVLKFYLHVSRAEQARRLRARLEHPEKNWKFSKGDLAERARWEAYMEAYEDALNRCSTKWAPWHIVPADKKWARDCLVARTMVKQLERLNLRYPRPKEDLSKIVVR